MNGHAKGTFLLRVPSFQISSTISPLFLQSTYRFWNPFSQKGFISDTYTWTTTKDMFIKPEFYSMNIEYPLLPYYLSVIHSYWSTDEHEYVFGHERRWYSLVRNSLVHYSSILSKQKWRDDVCLYMREKGIIIMRTIAVQISFVSALSNQNNLVSSANTESTERYGSNASRRAAQAAQVVNNWRLYYRRISYKVVSSFT